MVGGRVRYRIRLSLLLPFTKLEAELMACQTDVEELAATRNALAESESNLKICQTNLAKFELSLTEFQENLRACQTDLEQCRTGP